MTSTTWDLLSPSSREAMEWARAVAEVNDRSSVTLSDVLGGTMRSHPGKSELEELGQHFEIDTRKLVPSYLDATQKLDLTETPPLNEDASTAVDVASKLAQGHPAGRTNPEEVEIRHLFGAVLEDPDSAMNLALRSIFTDAGRIGFENVVSTYTLFLDRPSGSNYGEFLREVVPRTDVDLAARMTSDLPSAEDRLGFGALSGGLYDFITGPGTQLPLAVAISAPWGSGKSTVMRRLREMLYYRADADWTVAAFPVWKYEKSERVWAAMAKEIYNSATWELSRRPFGKANYQSPSGKVRRKLGGWWRQLQFRWRLQRERSGQAIAQMFTSPPFIVGLILAVAFLGMSWVPEQSWTGEGLAGSLVVVATGALVSLLRSDAFKKAVDRYVSAPDYEGQLGFTTEAERDIGALVRTITRNDRKLAVFVDDLDRCSPQHVVEVVEAVNQIFNASDTALPKTGDIDEVEERQCVFVIGMDREIVATSIEVFYAAVVARMSGSLDGDAHGYGHHFLDKLVQFNVDLPSPKAKLLADLLGRQTATHGGGIEFARPPESPASTPPSPPTPPKEEPDSIQTEARRLFIEDSQLVSDAERAAVAHLNQNPRLVKRFDNLFRFHLYVLLQSEWNQPTSGQLDALAKWVAMRLRWPRLMADIDRNPALLRDIEIGAVGSNAISGGLADAYLVEHATWFDDGQIHDVLQSGGDTSRVGPILPNLYPWAADILTP